MDKKCPHCNRPIPKGSSFCMYCFNSVNNLKEPVINHSRRSFNPRITLLACAVFAIVTISVLAVVSNSNNKPEVKAQYSTTLSEPAAKTTFPATTSIKTKEETKTTAVTKEKTTEQISLKSADNEETQTVQTSAKKTTRKTTTTTTTKSNKVIISSGVLKKYPSSKGSASYTIPYEVEKISDNAFERNSHLQTLKFSRRENLQCDWDKLFSALPNLKTIYIYPGTSVDTRGMQYFDGEIIYYYD
ncbi:MAG: zinc ribbon domain-containing protein [Eubacterium sp.]|nr:zinc ribbon domain-containing protein [Eubacterium sp.]